jgi:hypothetical protein
MRCLGAHQGARLHPSWPRCSGTTRWSGGAKPWSHRTVEGKRVGAATRTIAGAPSKPTQTRHASTTCWGNGWSHAAGSGQAPRHGSSRAVGTDRQENRASSCWGARVGGARLARGERTSNAGPHGRTCGPRARASPCGVRRTATAGCPCWSSGATPHAVGMTMTTESRGTPPADKSAATTPYGGCGSGSSGVAHATVIPGQATPQYWSASTWPDHGALDDPRRDRQPARPQPTGGRESS